MRLIDADARVTVQSFDAMNEEYSHDKMTVEQALDFVTDEGCPPTVGAIPVEWLEDKELDYRTTGDKMFMSAFAVVISEWQKEQRAR